MYSRHYDRLYASPISSPPFTYDRHDGLRVNNHARCASNQLYALLTYTDPGPVLTRQGKPRVHQPPPHKDPSAAFYEAQLVHYGLEPQPQLRKAKGHAKNALLFAFEASVYGTLTVPRRLVRLERDLAAQFEAKDAAAKRESNAQWEREMAEIQLKWRKRKREDDELVAEFREATATAKRAKGNTVRLDQWEKKARPLPLVERCGSYRIAAPAVSAGGGGGSDPMLLKLALSSTGGHLWGSFHFGDVKGTLRSRSALTAADRTVHFQWRGRETGEGVTTYDCRNMAEFTFLGDGRITGTLYWDALGTFPVMGSLQSGPAFIHRLSDQVSRWKEGYWSINDANYEAENFRRFGKQKRRRDTSISLEESEPNSDSDGQGCVGGYGQDEGDEVDDENEKDKDVHKDQDEGSDGEEDGTEDRPFRV